MGGLLSVNIISLFKKNLHIEIQNYKQGGGSSCLFIKSLLNDL